MTGGMGLTRASRDPQCSTPPPSTRQYCSEGYPAGQPVGMKRHTASRIARSLLQGSGTSSTSLSFDAPGYAPVGQAQDLRKRDDGRYWEERCAVVVLNRPRRGLVAFPPSTERSVCRKKGKMCVPFGLSTGVPVLDAGARRHVGRRYPQPVQRRMNTNRFVG